MLGLQERFTAASREFKDTLKFCSTATKDCAVVVFDRKSGEFAKMNGALHMVGIPLIALPLAVSSSVYALFSGAEMQA